ncbi:DNA translocase FtsK [Paenibacillus septentrionalis]|uniref:DNA translocase FtsK n=1 Tax=Paenibacillus septentrionalis TaxID=429342 RepID=A0ABW1V085_9BACL
MAKKRKKKRSIGAQLKYEVYGILIITISMIALSGEAAVGRALSRFFGIILGKFYFVLAIAGIIIGLSVMIKRAWPKGWTSRKTGIVIAVLAFTLSSSISHINARYMGLDDAAVTGSMIFKTLDEELRSQLFASNVDGQQPSIRDLSISGGYVGALQYSLLFMLFGYYGALILNIVQYLIAFLLITGKSYVDMLRFVRTKSLRLYKLLTAKLSLIRARRKAISKAQQASYTEDVMDDDEEETYQPEQTAKKQKKSWFFQTNTDTTTVQDDWELHHRAENSFEHEEEAVLEGYVAADDDKQQETLQTNMRARSESPSNEAYINEQESSEYNNTSYNDLEEQQAYENELEWQAAEGSSLDAANNQPEGHHAIAHLADQLLAEQQHETEPPEIEHDDEAYSYPEGQAVTSDALITEADINDSTKLVHAPLASTPIPYEMPPFSLLSMPKHTNKATDGHEMYDARRKLEATLESFGVRAKVLDVVRGPAVTRYEVQPATGVKVSRIVGLTDDIALALAAKDVRMEAPIPGKSAIGIEVPNGEVSVVTMREVMETPVFMNAQSKLSIAFGRDISGQTIVGNLAKMPHLLVAGATGSGKSVCINGIIASILYKAKPDEVKFLMIDPKMVELNVYNGIPHLIAPVVTNPKRASLALKKIVVEMEKRYELFSKSGTRNIEGYNQLMKDDPSLVLPYIVVIVDELADLMMVASNEVEDSIARLAQMARAAGIHLIIATQRPSVDVITGVIKANIPSRIAFGVSSQVDSRTILDSAGAEKLLGRGDMLFLPMGMNKPIRVQGAFLSDEEVEALVTFVRGQGEVKYNEELVPELDEDTDEAQDDDMDELFDEAARIVIEGNQASVSLLQRRMRIGYTRAARLIDQLEAKGIVGPYEGSKPRTVLVSQEQWNAK